MSSATSFDLRLAGGTVVLPGGPPQLADVLVSGGTIAGIVAPGTPADARETLDVSGRHVLPGVVDAHVHLGADITVPRTPEDVAPETAAAAAGGVTSLVAYLMSADPYDDVLPPARAAMEADSRIDFGFHFCIGTREQLEAIPHYVQDLGVSSFKFFMNFRTDEGLRLGLPGNDDGFLLELLQAARANGAIVNPHAENADLIKLYARDGVLDGEGSPLELWDRSRPDHVEAEALERIGFLSMLAQADVHAVHVTNEMSLHVLRDVRAHQPRISIETCPHYLTLDTSSDVGVEGKVNPPLRPAADREALWAAIEAGEVDTIGSDHVPRHGSFKEGGLAKASPGFPGMQQLLPLVLTEGHLRRGIALERLVDLVSTRPAQTFGLGDRKGAIRPGMDADLVVVDLDAPTTITAEGEFASAGFTPWEGVEVGVRVERTIVRGRTVFADGAPVGDAAGRYLPRHRSGVPTTTGVRA
ncbi:dihydroorotase family protein [Patulibacter sp.]|uniref:dihydroorotase n=1 Tax=Patulibacter sp. TaxID=1912859 RepID=UPI002720801A|nr:amidohydrolase family protein [Patulibacter sp.]MDO9407759.1 amidohydrolase family protein [Patulibacter sp.]